MQAPRGRLLGVHVLPFFRFRPSVLEGMRMRSRRYDEIYGHGWHDETAKDVGSDHHGGQCRRRSAGGSRPLGDLDDLIEGASSPIGIVPGLSRLEAMAALGIIGHVLECCLQCPRPFDPRPGVLIAANEDDERRDPSSVGAWMTAHERSAERPIQDSDVHIGQRRETNHIRDGVCRVGAPVLGHDQQAQVVTGVRETIDERGRDDGVCFVALPQVSMGVHCAQELRPRGRAIV